MSEIIVAKASAAPAPAGRWRVARAVALKEWAELRRDSRLAWLFALVLLLMFGALAFGAAQHMRLDRERDAAAATDRALWTGQGAKNPHAAAHFGQYAFKPQSPLALADPGVDAYVGEAVWLEAHRQNEAQFRSARDAGVGARLGGLSFAFVLQTIMPLVAVLLGFAGFSGERERGTLRQLMSLGASPVDILAGKALAALGALAVLLVPAFSLAVLATLLLADHDVSVVDQLQRLLAFSFGYGLYLCGFVFLALGVSAAAKSTRTALVTLLAFWLANCFLAPRVMTDVAKRVATLPTALEFRNAIAEDKKRTFGHDEQHPAFVAFRDGVLAQYGVARIEDLPVNFRGLALRKDDENGFVIFDKHFGALQAAFDAQDRLALRWALSSPCWPCRRSRRASRERIPGINMISPRRRKRIAGAFRWKRARTSSTMRAMAMRAMSPRRKCGRAFPPSTMPRRPSPGLSPMCAAISSRSLSGPSSPRRSPASRRGASDPCEAHHDFLGFSRRMAI